MTTVDYSPLTLAEVEAKSAKILEEWQIRFPDEASIGARLHELDKQDRHLRDLLHFNLHERIALFGLAEKRAQEKS